MQFGEEMIRLASADNFRDVADADAGLRRGVVYRSNELQLLDEDAATLADLGIAAIYDLRDDYEVEAHPDIEIPGATWTHAEIKGIPPGTGAELPDAEAARAAIIGVYRRFVTDPDARTSFATVLRAVATSSAPMLFHCTAGKDRTGWAAALMLHVAGVERGVVETDYLETNNRSAGTREKYLGLVAEHLGPDRVATFEPTMVADLSYLDAAYTTADAEYGSLDGYLRDGLGLDDDILAALRSRLRA